MKIKSLNIPGPSSQWIDSSVVIKSENFHDFVPQTIGFPEASPELIILLSGQLSISYDDKIFEVNKSCLFTFIDKPIVIIPSSNVHIIKIAFRPLGVFPLVKLSAISSRELTHSPILLAEDIFGDDIRRLEHQIFESQDDGEVEQLLAAFLDKKFNKNDLSPTDCSIINLTNPRIYTVDELCNTLYLTPRTLQRWFSRNMDISPKFYLRLLRLKSLLNDLSSANHTDYLSIAINNGFYDQNHMIKEIKKFIDKTPSEVSFSQYLSVQLKIPDIS